MRTRVEQGRDFMIRAQAFEQKAAEASDGKIRETLLSLAQHYRHLAAQAISGPYN
jgi:hypothetical protein